LTEIETGERIQLDWSLDKFDTPGFGRKKLEHEILDLGKSMKGVDVVGHDDEVSRSKASGKSHDNSWCLATHQHTK
jgi:hypothetical protein